MIVGGRSVCVNAVGLADCFTVRASVQRTSGVSGTGLTNWLFKRLRRYGGLFGRSIYEFVSRTFAMKIEGAPTHFAALREIAQRDPISDFNTCYWREVDRVRIDCRFILSRRSRSARVQDRCLPLA